MEIADLAESHYVYINYSEKFDKYCIGQTSNFESRISMHNTGKVLFTKPYLSWVKVLLLDKKIRSEAVIIERKLKKLNCSRLKAFIEKNN